MVEDDYVIEDILPANSNGLADSELCSGAVGAKNVFSSLCSLFTVIPKIEGVQCPFKYEFRARLARIVLKHQLTVHDSQLVAMSVAAVCVDSKTNGWSEDDWSRYCFASARNAREEKLARFTPLLDKFKARLTSLDIFLTDHEHSLYADFLEMARSFDFLHRNTFK